MNKKTDYPDLERLPDTNFWKHLLNYAKNKTKLHSNKSSSKASYQTNGRIFIGTKGPPNLPRFKGLIDNLRVYNYALSADEIVKHIKDEAVDHELAMAVSAAQSAAGATQFFKTHPNEIDLKEEGDSILFANKQIGLEFVKGKRGFQINRLYGIGQDHDFLTTETVIEVLELPIFFYLLSFIIIL